MALIRQLRIWHTLEGWHVGLNVPGNNHIPEQLMLGWANVKDPCTIKTATGDSVAVFSSAACLGLFRLLGIPMPNAITNELLYSIKFGKDDVTFGMDINAEVEKQVAEHKIKQDTLFEQRVQAEVNARMLQAITAASAPVKPVAAVKPKRKYIHKAKPILVLTPEPPVVVEVPKPVVPKPVVAEAPKVHMLILTEVK